MKIRGWLVPVAALAGFAIAAVAVIRSERPVERPIPARQARDSTPPESSTEPDVPFASYVAGTGVVEAGTGNIAVGAPVAGIVAEVLVKWGQPVRPGDALFRIDDRELRAQLPTAQARVSEADAKLAQSRYESQLADQLHAQHVLSDEQYQGRKFQVRIDEAALATARAEVERIRTEIERRTVRATVAGRVLQINTHPGEFADSGVAATPLMVVGDDTRLRVRVDIDQNEATRVRPGAPAMAFVRGEPGVKTPLEFESIEPYVVPKRSLTGDTAERVDTRVLQAIYGFDRTALPVYVGQQLDVYISTADGTGPAP